MTEKEFVRQLNIQLSEEQYQKIEVIAKSDDRSIQYVIRRYIDSLAEPKEEIER